MKLFKKTVLMIAAFSTVFMLGKTTAKAADFNSQNGAWTTISVTSNSPIGNHDVYTRFKANATGKLVINATDFFGYVSLCNSSKKVIASEEFSSNGCFFSANSSYPYQRTLTFGVKKNTTYYIRFHGYGKLQSNYDSNTMVTTYKDTYRIRPVNTKISTSSGSKKSKAKTIKKNKTKKGVIVAGSSKSDWYKFKLTKSKKLKFYLNGGMNDRLKITVYRKGGKLYNNTFYIGRSYEKKTFSSYKVPKGTYYIKVQSYKKGKGSGWYSIKWK